MNKPTTNATRHLLSLVDIALTVDEKIVAMLSTVSASLACRYVPAFDVLVNVA